MKKSVFILILIIVSFENFAQQFIWKSVNNQGMGFVTGMIIHPDIATAPDLIYVRTDVGGAYRFDPANQKWIQLMDFASSLQTGYFRVESMAIDPNNPEKVYAAVDGQIATKGEVLVSLDKGTSWQTTGLAAKNIYIAGNDPWRGTSGERLMVDPNNSDIIYYGSRKDGLWIKEGTGTWTKVSGGLPATAANPGFTFVLFDKKSSDGLKSQVIYTGCFGSGVWKSEDAGINWININGGTNCLRASLGNDTTLYVSFGGHEQEYQGPGKVARYKNGIWTAITPASGTAVGYSGICNDPLNDSIVVVTTNQRSMYYSKNQGTKWIRINSKFSYYPSYYNSGESSFNWGTAALLIDPNNTQRLWSTNGYGVIKTDNYTAATSIWTTVMNNLEELCVRAISTPPLAGGADLITVGMDMVGMRNASRDIVPTKKIAVFPYVSMGVSIEYCETKPNHIVFLGLAETSTDAYYGYSKDNGLTWTKFTSTPGKGGKLVLSSTDENNWVWTPDGETVIPQYTMDAGKTWTPCNGITGPWHVSTWAQMSYLAADKVNGSKFYYCNNGKMFYSEDGGANWSAGYQSLPGWPHNMFLKAHPYREGEMWFTIMPNDGQPKQKIFVSKNGGKTFTVLNTVNFANNIAFGKGDNDSIPYVYMSGKVGTGEEGIYKSTDEGKTWTLITDPAKLKVAIVLEADMRYKNLVYTGGGACRGVIYGMAEQGVGIDNPSNSAINANNIFPNPTTDFLTITSEEVIKSVVIFDLLGRELKRVDVNCNKAQISVEDLLPGCYLILTESAKTKQTGKFLKN
jgi:hypothetical protein